MGVEARVRIAEDDAAAGAGPPAFQKPHEFTTFSLDKKREFLEGSVKLKYYHPPRSLSECPDLSDGLSTFERREHRQEHLDSLLRALSLSGIPTADGFVTWRGILTRIVCTPFSSDAWEFIACRVDGHIYMCEEKGPDSFANASHERSTYWGYKFEQLMTCNERKAPSWEDRRASFSQPVNNSEEFCSVVKTRLGAHRLILGAEVDCTDPSARVPSDAYIELKTSAVLDSDRADTSFRRHRLLKYWAQSFLIGVPSVVVGFRDAEGRLRELETFRTSQLPKMAREVHGATWDPNVCLRFGERLLQAISSHVAREGREHIYTIRRDARRDGDFVVISYDEGKYAPFLPIDMPRKGAPVS